MPQPFWSMIFNGWEKRLRHSFVAHGLAVLFILLIIMVFALAVHSVINHEEKLSSLTTLLLGILAPLMAPVTAYIFKKAQPDGSTTVKEIPFKIELKTALEGREVNISVDANADPELNYFVKNLILKSQEVSVKPIKTE